MIEFIGLLKRPHANKAFVTRNYTLADLNRELREVQHTATCSSTPGIQMGGVRKENGRLMASHRQPTLTR